MFKIPKFIKIGGRLIPIERLQSSNMDGFSGSHSSWTSKIRIANDSDLPEEQEKIALIHEIIEHLNDKYQYNISHPTIQGLAEHFYQILVDNTKE